MQSNEPKPIRSEFADDPDMAELVAEYVGRMPQRVNAILSACERNEREQLIRIVHQIKGSGGGYGFPQLSIAAGRIESRLLGSPAMSLEQIDPDVRELVNLCRRMAA